MKGRWALFVGKREQLSVFIREAKRPPNVIIALLSVIFAVVWALNWQGENDLFSNQWWFDALGHAVAGFGGALALRYLIRKYAAKGFFVFEEGRRFLNIVVEAWVMRLAILWEALEFSWDMFGLRYQMWVTRAQIDLIDTMVDILAAVFMAKVAVFLASLYDNWYEGRYPDESEQEEIDEVVGMVSRVSRSKYMRRRAKRRRRIEKAIVFLKEELDKIGDKFKDDQN